MTRDERDARIKFLIQDEITHKFQVGWVLSLMQSKRGRESMLRVVELAALIAEAEPCSKEKYTVLIRQRRAELVEMYGFDA
jgi:hypothetical protein